MPQAILVIGNGLATKDLGGYVSDNWADLAYLVAAEGHGLTSIGLRKELRELRLIDW